VVCYNITLYNIIICVQHATQNLPPTLQITFFFPDFSGISIFFSRFFFLYYIVFGFMREPAKARIQLLFYSF
jgi:hypothetical protein